MIRAVFFDLDGTLVDTEPLQWRAYRETLLRYGVEVGLDEYADRFIRQGGGPEWACTTHDLPLTPAALRAEKAVVYQTYVPALVEPCPNARDALVRLAPAYRLAVVTNSDRNDTAGVLAHVGLLEFFETLVTREDYAEAKPAPDAYREAGRRFGLAAAECLVVEDTARGTHAALAAGMRVVAVPNALTARNDFSGATRVLSTLDELTPALLQALGGER